MRISNILILGLMVLVSACSSVNVKSDSNVASSVNVKSDSDIAVRQYGQPFAYWFTTIGGCRVADEGNLYTYEWYGRCENGLVTGCGKLLARSVEAKGAVIKEMDGCFAKGLKNGKFRQINGRAGEHPIYSIEYVQGLAVRYDQESPRPLPVPQRLPDDPKTVGRGARG